LMNEGKANMSELVGLNLYEMKFFNKQEGAVLRGSYVGCMKAANNSTPSIYFIKMDEKSSCLCRLGHHEYGAIVYGKPGDLVGFVLTNKGRADFDDLRIAEGDSMVLKINRHMNIGHGRFIWDEEVTKLAPSAPPVAEEARPAAPARRWFDIVALAKSAYRSTTEDGFRARMIALAGAILDFEQDRDLVALVAKATVDEKAFADERVERGEHKVGDDGESNQTRWNKSAVALAKAMLDGPEGRR